MLSKSNQSKWPLVRDDDGTTAVEYAVMLAVIIAGMVAIFSTGDITRILWTDSADTLTTSLSN